MNSTTRNDAYQDLDLFELIAVGRQELASNGLSTGQMKSMLEALFDKVSNRVAEFNDAVTSLENRVDELEDELADRIDEIVEAKDHRADSERFNKLVIWLQYSNTPAAQIEDEDLRAAAWMIEDRTRNAVYH